MLRQVQVSAFFMVTIAFASPSMATVILDQFQLTGDQTVAIHSTIATPPRIGQTFTVGAAGLLHSVELSLLESGSGGDLVVNILDMSGGNLSLAPSLGSVSLAEADLGPFVLNLSPGTVTGTLVDLTSLGITVDVGDVLAIDLSSVRALPDLYGVRRNVLSNIDEYGPGAHFAGNTFFDNADLAFKMFVDAPEPTTLALLGLALAGLGFARRRVN